VKLKPFDVFVGFLMGAAAGSAASFLFLNNRYRKKYEEDFNKLKEEFSNPKVSEFFQKQREISEEVEEAADDQLPHLKKKPIQRRKPGEKGYTDYTSFYHGGAKVEEPSSDEEDLVINDLCGDPNAIPEVINPDEFGYDETYAQISLLYTTDGVLIDDTDEVFDGDPTSLPKDFAEHFGEYEDDSVYVKNDRIRVYYEILRSQKSSDEILSIKKK